MKKIFMILTFSLMLTNFSFAETYYFKGCNLSEKYLGHYLIDLDKKEIRVLFQEKMGEIVQERKYIINSITKDQIVTEKKQNIQHKDYYFQYFFDANSKSVGVLKYKYEDTFFRPDGPKDESYCDDVKANWNKSKKKAIEKKKEEDENLILKSSLPRCPEKDLINWTNCRGTYTSNDGYKYIGEWKDAKQYGKGIEIWPDGRKYIGQFKNDKRHGKGIFTLADGTKFDGEYKEGKQHGQGTLTFSRGDKYVGQFKNGRLNGQGTYKFASGVIHSGKFKNGVIVEGTAKYLDGTKFVGNFEFDKPNGQGTVTYSNGAKYVGQFVDGYEYGEGICFKPNGSSAQCIMENTSTSIGWNKYKISVIAKKWTKIDASRSLIEEKLINNFNNQASEHCLLTGTGNFKELEKKMGVIEIDETPAFGLEPKIKLGINGVVECQ